MKLAITSASFEHALQCGALTQLEWLESCGTALEVNGVVFDGRHFARTDDEYLAQLAKLAADRGLSAAAVRCDLAIGADDAALEDGLRGWVDAAAALKAPVLIVPAIAAGDSTVLPVQRALRTLKALARHGKARNVLIALANTGGTLCATGADFQRLAKDVDSAWLRLALDPASFTPDDVAACSDRIAIVTARPETVATALERCAGFRGFLAVDANGRDVEDVAAVVGDINHTYRLHTRF